MLNIVIYIILLIWGLAKVSSIAIELLSFDRDRTNFAWRKTQIMCMYLSYFQLRGVIEKFVSFSDTEKSTDFKEILWCSIWNKIYYLELDAIWKSVMTS